jgi:hypothetical protein
MNESENLAPLQQQVTKDESNSSKKMPSLEENEESENQTSGQQQVTKDESNSSKKKRSSEESEETSKRCRSSEEDVLDLAHHLKLQPGDRLEVEWTVGDEEDEKMTTRWWGATLLEHDGRTEDRVCIRTLEYDAFPPLFPEKSKEDVIFLGRDIIVEPVSQEELHFRREGDVTPEVWLGRSQVEEVVNATLMNAMQKNSKAWKALSTAQQAMIACSIASKKEKLLELLMAHEGRVVTPGDMNSLLAQTLEE